MLFIYVFLFLIGTFAGELEAKEDESCTLIPKVVTIEQVTEPVEHAEGPYWDERSQKLFFVDIHKHNIYSLNPTTGALTYTYISTGEVGVAIGVEDSPDQLIVGAGTKVVLVTWDSEKNETDPTIEVLATVDTDRNKTRFNDGKIDSHGRLWAGTLGEPEINLGSLYRMGSDYVCEREISPVNISNGCAWNSADDTFYYIDSPSLQIAAYDFDADNGTISNRRIVFDLPSNNITGTPDGMTIDTNDNLWIALYDGGHVINVDPVTSRLIQSIEMPVNRVTSVAWGGSLLDILYVTTSRYQYTQEQLENEPIAGAVFAIKGLQARGLAANTFVWNRQN